MTTKFNIGDRVKVKGWKDNIFVIERIFVNKGAILYGFEGRGIVAKEDEIEKLDAYIIKKNNVPYEGKYQTIEQAKRVMRTVAGDEYGRLLREYQDNTIMMRCDDIYAIITILYTDEHNSSIIYEVESV